jgi:putative phage-type endonuclease
MLMALALVPRSPEWHADRQKGIGSADAPIITGDAPRSWGDPIELLQRLYGEKVGLLDPADRPDNTLMEWGRRLEDVIADWYSEQPNGHKLQRIGRRSHPDHEWMSASLDRHTVGARPRRLVEIKTAPYGGDQWGEPGTAEIPLHVLIQVQHQLAVVGYSVADVAVLIHGSDPRIYTVERDDELIAGLIELESDFMACVREGRTPDYAGLADKGKRVRPPVDGEITADPALDRLIASTFAATETRKAAEEAERGLKARLTELIDPYAVVHGSAVDVIYRPNRPSVKVGWEYVAKAYRKAIAGLQRDIGGEIPAHWDVDLDAIESTFTVEQAGARPVRFTERKED